MTTIRTVQPDDLMAVSRLFNLYRVFYKQPDDISGAAAFLSERFRLSDSQILVAVNKKGELIGFTQLYPLFSSTRMKRLWLLNDLFVLEECRGQGISKKLIAAAKELAINTNACGLLLETAKTNLIGNQLYPATGFVLENNSNFYFWTNESSNQNSIRYEKK